MPRTRRHRQLEDPVLKGIKAALEALGLIVYRRNVGFFLFGEGDDKRAFQAGETGQADLWGWDPRTGRHWEIEVKAPDKKPTAKQTAWLKRCHATGCVAFWADNVPTAINVAQAVLNGARIVWKRGSHLYDLEYED